LHVFVGILGVRNEERVEKQLKTVKKNKERRCLQRRRRHLRWPATAPPPTVASHRAATSDHRLSVGEDEEKRERREGWEN